MNMEYWELKELVLKHYGNKCIECEESESKQLRIVFADKKMQFWRKKFGLVCPKTFYYYLYKLDFPEKFKMPGKYKLIVLCKMHYNEFVSAMRKGIPRSPEIRQKISNSMKAKKRLNKL